MKTQYEHRVTAEKNRVMTELENIARFDTDSGTWRAKSADVDESEADPSDHADRFENFEEKSALIEPLVIRLAEFDAALARIEDGTYGSCIICNNPIEEARLEANPAASTCMAHL